ncbi:methylmalonyl Co-A mutase-associated GTPase MeaB [Granulosicoccus antarcticus]|uniref:Putative GTPase n=1 Tax=Granulosicoccus antarcticus IMCC3135 TaxID=1192854 RepID=A0A2Z2NXA6_9GAMM|nr:methylmalonyl Co-A mutase-associated GTPase MeaB [Granulosicoccus antarcticus]ASJ75095.1 putative GTPase [Granulosicoccus antarcticus IMCC3135]
MNRNETLAQGVLAREPAMLSQAITLAESNLAAHRAQAQDILQRLLSRTGKAMRIGISGAPGGGKSRLIEALGLRLIEQGHRVAVLAIDSSSQPGGGNTPDDKTRMAQLSLRDEAYVRHSLTSGHPDSDTRVSRESLLLCEAAGFDVILVETVGVAQTEAGISKMVDCCLLLVSGADDELQSIEKGMLELADIVAVNKADGNTINDAGQARATSTCQHALSLLQPASSWKPVALTCSATTGDGLDELWQNVRTHRRQMIDTGELVERREQQRISWT